MWRGADVAYDDCILLKDKDNDRHRLRCRRRYANNNRCRYLFIFYNKKKEKKLHYLQMITKWWRWRWIDGWIMVMMTATTTSEKNEPKKNNLTPSRLWRYFCFYVIHFVGVVFVIAAIELRRIVVSSNHFFWGAWMAGGLVAWSDRLLARPLLVWQTVGSLCCFFFFSFSWYCYCVLVVVVVFFLGYLKNHVDVSLCFFHNIRSLSLS